MCEYLQKPLCRLLQPVSVAIRHVSVVYFLHLGGFKLHSPADFKQPPQLLPAIVSPVLNGSSNWVHLTFDLKTCPGLPTSQGSWAWTLNSGQAGKRNVISRSCDRCLRCRSTAMRNDLPGLNSHEF